MSTERRRDAHDELFIVGVIGRAGSGKSTVARALAQDGAEVIDADALGHDVTDHDLDVRAQLMTEYGADIYRSDGRLDRARVASRVFADPAARARLDRLVHPRIIDRFRARLDALRAEGFRGVVVFDAALLLEWGLDASDCDGVIAVTAAEASQIHRLARSRGWSPEQTRQRLAVQRSNDVLSAAADVTLVNDGTEAELEQTAREAVRELRNRRAARKEPC